MPKSREEAKRASAAPPSKRDARAELRTKEEAPAFPGDEPADAEKVEAIEPLPGLTPDGTEALDEPPTEALRQIIEARHPVLARATDAVAARVAALRSPKKPRKG